MEMLHLRYFVAVAEELHFTRAARRLHMSTSPLSRRIRDLESQLGAQLLVRGRTIELTSAGEKLLPLAREIVTHFDALPNLLGTPRSARPAILGIAPEVTAATRSGYLGAIASAHPALEVQLHLANSGRLIDAVLTDQIDLALVHGPVSARELSYLKVDSHRVGVIVGAGKGFDDLTAIRLDQVADIPFASIAYSAAPELYRRTDALLHDAGVHRRIIVEGDNRAALIHLVATGRAFTLDTVDDHMNSKSFAGQPVIALAVEGVRLRLTTTAVWRTERATADETVSIMVEAVRSSTSSRRVLPQQP